MRVLHSSLRPFINATPTLFPESDRRLGVIVRMEPTSHHIAIVESESPSFVSITHGERIESESSGKLDRAAVDSIVRAHLIDLAHQCEKIAEELMSHAARFHKIGSQKVLLVDDTGVERDNGAYYAHGRWSGNSSSAVVPAASMASPRSTMRPSPSPPPSTSLDLEDI